MAMAELVLNALWLAVGTAAFIVTPKRSRRVTFALVCAVALLFPIISISDVLIARDTLEDVFAVVVALIVITAMLMALAAIEPERRSRARLTVAILSY